MILCEKVNRKSKINFLHTMLCFRTIRLFFRKRLYSIFPTLFHHIITDASYIYNSSNAFKYVLIYIAHVVCDTSLYGLTLNKTSLGRSERLEVSRMIKATSPFYPYARGRIGSTDDPFNGNNRAGLITTALPLNCDVNCPLSL